jgi:hypothetical protein
MAQVVQTAPCSIIAHLPASQLVGTMVSGCVDQVEADENCVGFQNQLAHTTVTEPKWLIPFC